MWIVTQEINDYNQYGEYFITAFEGKPTFEQLKKVLNLDDVTTGKLTRGGGRQNIENEWYYLKEFKQEII